MKISILYVVDRERKLEQMVIVVETMKENRLREGGWKRRIVMLSTERVKFVGIEK